MSEMLAWQAVARLYNALLTGSVIGLVAHHGSATAREFVFRLFRRQQLEKFLPGLAKLGLAGEPHAVACALYHYHSNALGGVLTEFVRESDRKAWVRYPPPRWMWRGTAIAAIPHEVSAAMLHGWHGHNGVSLGNPRLGFVCTGMTVDGQPGLEGYYLEHERDLSEHERVRFAYGEETMPPFDSAAAPRLADAEWPDERRARAHRSYAVAYVQTMLPVLQAVLGAEAARNALGRTAKLIGLQFHAGTARALGMPSNLSAGTLESASRFAEWLAAMLRAQGETVDVGRAGEAVAVQLAQWRMAEGITLADPLAAFDAWNDLWVGALGAHDRFLALETERSLQRGAWSVRWRIMPRRG